MCAPGYRIFAAMRWGQLGDGHVVGPRSGVDRPFLAARLGRAVRRGDGRPIGARRPCGEVKDLDGDPTGVSTPPAITSITRSSLLDPMPSATSHTHTAFGRRGRPTSSGSGRSARSRDHSCSTRRCLTIRGSRVLVHRRGQAGSPRLIGDAKVVHPAQPRSADRRQVRSRSRSAWSVMAVRGALTCTSATRSAITNQPTDSSTVRPTVSRPWLRRMHSFASPSDAAIRLPPSVESTSTSSSSNSAWSNTNADDSWLIARNGSTLADHGVPNAVCVCDGADGIGTGGEDRMVDVVAGGVDPPVGLPSASFTSPPGRRAPTGRRSPHRTARPSRAARSGR